VGGQLSSFSQRLKAERQRLGMNQTTFASLGNVSKDAQLNYENGSRRPDSSYLEAVAVHGVDVLYLLTGQSSSATLAGDEQVLLAGYRGLDPKGRAGVLGMIGGMAQAESSTASKARAKVQQTFHEGVTIGQHIKGDMTVTAPFTMHVGAPVKKKGKQRTS
jgi:transcriptional regulator with XRE-family HTH domain